MKPNRSTCFLSQEAFDRIKSNYSKFNEPWQGSEIEELKTMAADQVPFEQIANQLQRTPNSVKMKLKTLGLYTPKPMPGTWSSDDEARLIEMYNDDLPFEDIAQELGRSVSAVVTRLVHLRINLFEKNG